MKEEFRLKISEHGDAQRKTLHEKKNNLIETNFLCFET